MLTSCAITNHVASDEIYCSLWHIVFFVFNRSFCATALTLWDQQKVSIIAQKLRYVISLLQAFSLPAQVLRLALLFSWILLPL
jgi:hypothetical protein